jgi:hypothetical protein
MSDNFEPLVEAARGGDERALRALLEPLNRELHAYAYRMLGGFEARAGGTQLTIVHRACQDITVAGFTMVRASAHRDHTRESTAQNARSIGSNRGRFVFRSRTANALIDVLMRASR